MEAFLASKMNPELDIITRIITQMRGGKVDKRISFEEMCKALDKDADDQEYLVQVCSGRARLSLDPNSCFDAGGRLCD